MLTSLASTNWGLVLLLNGTWQPDVVLATNLKLDKTTLQTRLVIVNQLLAVQEAEPNELAREPAGTSGR